MDRVRMQLGLSNASLPDAARHAVTVAVLDSGVTRHPDLKDALLAFRDFSGKGGKNKKRQYDQTPYDDYGHGTHVSGILCGSGALSLGRYQGICPRAKLLMGKVLDENGDGSVDDMLKGMEWILETRKKWGTRILNVSVGISMLNNPYKERKLHDMLEELSRNEILVVCAAGNKGPAPGSLSFLGGGKEVISVGCHDGAYYRGDPERCENYSGRGVPNEVPRKPDVVAPGTKIRSCSGCYQKGMRAEQGYVLRSGTSMATPIVAGCLALALERAPELSGRQLRKLLTQTAMDLREPWNKQGFGMVNPRGMLGSLEKENNFR